MTWDCFESVSGNCNVKQSLRTHELGLTSESPCIIIWESYNTIPILPQLIKRLVRVCIRGEEMEYICLEIYFEKKLLNDSDKSHPPY